MRGAVAVLCVILGGAAVWEVADRLLFRTAPQPAAELAQEEPLAPPTGLEASIEDLARRIEALERRVARPTAPMNPVREEIALPEVAAVPDPVLSDLAASVHSLRVEVASLRAGVARATHEVSAPETPSAIAEVDARSAIDLEAIDREARVRRWEEQDRLYRRWKSEDVDERWTSDIARSLDSALRSSGADSAPRSADCRETLCRVSFRVKEPDLDLGSVVPVLGFKGTAAVFADPGDPDVTLFLMRAAGG